MNGDLAYQEERREELLDGKIYMMSSPSVNHNIISFNIARSRSLTTSASFWERSSKICFDTKRLSCAAAYVRIKANKKDFSCITLHFSCI